MNERVYIAGKTTARATEVRVIARMDSCDLHVREVLRMGFTKKWECVLFITRFLWAGAHNPSGGYTLCACLAVP